MPLLNGGEEGLKPYGTSSILKSHFLCTKFLHESIFGESGYRPVGATFELQQRLYFLEKADMGSDRGLINHCVVLLQPRDALHQQHKEDGEDSGQP